MKFDFSALRKYPGTPVPDVPSVPAPTTPSPVTSSALAEPGQVPAAEGVLPVPRSEVGHVGQAVTEANVPHHIARDGSAGAGSEQTGQPGHLGQAQVDASTVIADACRDLPVAPAAFRRWLAPEDIRDIEDGHFSAAYVRGFAHEYIRMRTLGRITEDDTMDEPASYPLPPMVSCEHCAHFTPGSSAAAIGVCAIPEDQRTFQTLPLWALADRYCNRWERRAAAATDSPSTESDHEQ